MWSQRLRSSGDVLEVGLMEIVERSGYADDDCVHFTKRGAITCCSKAAVPGFLDLRRGNTEDIRFSFGERGDLEFISIKAGYRKSLLDKQQRQGQPNIPQTYNADVGGPVVDFV